MMRVTSYEVDDALRENLVVFVDDVQDYRVYSRRCALW
jgi:hypothetical protein